MHIELILQDDKDSFIAFSSFMHRGFQVKARVGTSIKDVLCSQFNVPEDTLDNWLKIIFLNGKPVDFPETAIVKDGSTIALSPYLGGIACRSLQRDSPISTFRDGITHQEEETEPAILEEGRVTIKLFNLTIKVLGPIFLKQGIWLARPEAEALFTTRSNALRPFILSAENSGQAISAEQLAALDWSQAPESVFLRVTAAQSE